MSRPPAWMSAVLLVAALAVSPTAAAGAGRLTIDGSSSGPRDVVLLRVGDTWQGQLTLLVRTQNVRRPAVLRVRYLRAAGRPLAVVGPGAASNRFVSTLRPRARQIRMVGRQIVPVALRFTVPAGERLSAIDGLLVADLRRTGRPVATIATLPVRGVMASARFEPSSIRLQVLRHCWLVDDTCGDEAKVIVRGEGVGSLARPNRPLGTAYLRNADGTSARVQLMPDMQDGWLVRTADSVQATLRADSFDGVGKMHGDLLLNPAPPGGPSLAIDLTTGDSLALAVLTVLLGAILGGWLVQRAGVRRKRRLLEIQLRSALERFESELHKSGGTAVSYDLTPALDPRPRHGLTNRPFPGRRGAAALIWHIRTAQDEADFDEVIGATNEMVAKIERWLAVEPVARATKQLLENQPPKRGTGEFSDCMTYREAELLLEKAKNGDPGDDAKAEAVRADLAVDGALLGQWKVLWELHRTLEEAAHRDPKIRARLETPEIAERLKQAGESTIESTIPSRDSRTADDVGKLRIDLRRAAKTVLDVMAEVGIEQPDTIRQRLDDAQKLAAQLENAANAPAIPRDDRAPESVLNRQYLMQVLRDQLWTLGRAAASSTAYALTIYDDTWGTPIDYATAFTTGFLTETIVNWAVMPALQSYRVRRAATQGAPDFRGQIIALIQQRLPAESTPGNGAVADKAASTDPPQ